MFFTLSSFEYKRTQHADEHITFMLFVLGIFGKLFDNVLCIIGDNCKTNQCIVTKLNVPLISGASH